jgi:O-antigen ligase
LFATDKARFVALCLFVACVFMMGGGSRADISSLVVLRPIAFLACSYALLVARPGELRAATLPLILLGCLAAVIALQLIPLSPEIWSALPGRDLYVRIAADAGLPLGPRPLTLSQSGTLNALFALSVPFAAILLYAVQGQAYRGRVLGVLLVGCGVSALVAIGQLAGSGSGPLYLYRVTNEGFPVGLMANRNHQALLMVILLVLIAYHCARLAQSGKSRPLLLVGAVVSTLVVLALLVVGGSRAGLLLGVAVLPLAGWMLVRAGNAMNGGRRPGFRGVGVAAIAGALGLAVAAALGLSRATSFSRLWSNDALADYRVERLPAVLGMLSEHWATGIGFGAFEGVFQRYETTDMLTPFIFNQAHSDWLQFPLEGGVAAGLLMLLVVARIAAAAPAAIRSAREPVIGDRFIGLVIVVLIALASTVDYPLRTPVGMLVGALAFMILTSPPRLENDRSPKERRGA